MDKMSELGKVLKRVGTTHSDYFKIESEKVKQTAFDEHIDACLDALVVTNNGDFEEYGLLDFDTSDDNDKPHSRIVIAGLGSTESNSRRLLVSVKDLKQDKLSASLLYIEYELTDDGARNIDWCINDRSLPQSENSNEIFAEALSLAVGVSAEKYLKDLPDANKH